MNTILNNISLILGLSAVICIIVFFAVVIDFCSGIYKSVKIRKQAIQSNKLRKTINKLITYEGCTFLGIMIDILLYFVIWQFADSVYKIPLISCAFGITILAVEIKSVYERADEKEKRDAEQVTEEILNLLGKIADKQNVVKNISNILKKDESK